MGETGGEMRLRIDDEGVRLDRSDGRVESVLWEELEEVGVVTTADGPFADDVFILLIASGGESGVGVPLSVGGEELLERMQALPGFDNEAYIRAMSNPGDGRATCWRRDPAEEAAKS